MRTERRSWLRAIKTLDYTNCAVLNMEVTECKTEWVQYLSPVTRTLPENGSVWRKNLKCLDRFSEQESEKYHSNILNERFLTSYIYTHKDRMLCRVTEFKGI